MDTQLVQVEWEERGSNPELTLVSDASHTGWRASCQRVHTGGGGSMVPSGEELPYQLPGAPGHFAGGEELFERSIQQTSDRQQFRT